MHVMLMGLGMYPNEVGGAQTHAYQVGRALAERGHVVSAVVFHFRDASRSDECFPDSVQLEVYADIAQYRVPLVRSTGRDGAQAGNRAALMQWFAAHVASSAPDVIHVFRQNDAVTALCATAPAHIPQVFTGLGFSQFCTIGSLRRKDGTICDGRASQGRCVACIAWGAKGAETIQGGLVGKLLAVGLGWLPVEMPAAGTVQAVGARLTAWQQLAARAAAAIAPSQVVARTFALNGFPIEKIVRMTYGIPDDLIVRRQAKTHQGRLRVAYLGKVSEYKGVHLLLEAARLAAAAGASFELKIYGGLDPDHDPYHRCLCDEYNSAPWPSQVSVEFSGRFAQERLPEIHAGIDLMVTPSLWPENATIVVLEALALGTPVLAADVEGIAEFIHTGQNGWLFRHGDVAHLAEQLMELARQPALVRRVALDTKPVLTMSVMATQLENLYLRLREGVQ